MGKMRLIAVAVLVAGAAGAAWWMQQSAGNTVSGESPDPAQWQQFSEHCAGDLRTLSREEAAYAEQAQDREWCHVNDFWASNVGELYTMTSASVATGDKDSTIRLIELSVASADEEADTPD